MELEHIATKTVQNQDYNIQRTPEIYPNKINGTWQNVPGFIDYLYVDDKIIGGISYCGKDGVGKVHGVNLSHSFQKKGLGEFLVRTAFEELMKDGITRISLNTREETQADKFWLYLGQKDDFPYEVKPRTAEDTDLPSDLFQCGPQLVAHLK